MTVRAITSADACTHHYWIDTPEAGNENVRGRCKYCGTERGFIAWWDEEERWSTRRTAARRER